MALPDYISLVGGTSRTTGISSQSVSSGANYIGAEIDNSSNLDDLADFEVIWQHATGVANKSLRLYLCYSYDGTNYEDADTSNEPVRLTLVRAWASVNDTNQHRMVVGGVPLLPYKFKVVVRNHDTGYSCTFTVNCKTRKAAQVID